jgi:branched-chain amino acid transport system substrate-binding protein
LKLVTFDDACSALQAQTTAAAVIASRPDVVIGHPCSNAAAAAAPHYAKAGIPFIATGATHAKLASGKASPLQFRVPAAATALGAALAQLVTRPDAETRVALVRDRTQQARLIMQDVEKHLATLKHTPALVALIAGGDKEFGPLVAKLKAAGVTHVVLVAFPNEGALLVQEAVTALPDLVIAAPDLLAAPDVARIAGKQASALRIAMAQDLLTNTAAQVTAQAIAEAIASAEATAPARGQNTTAETTAALAAHAALEAYLAAVRGARSRDAAVVAQWLQSKEAATLIGPLSFSATGDASTPSWKIHLWRDGALVASD